ncbi:MAG: insulinase family protein [Anaerolineales bacterium]|nr:insulinase family protein [Anaerolineales bacterium]
MTTSNFELVRDETIRELKTRARLYRHLVTGAEVLSLENDDENKVFGIAFRTPPADSTGIAHIMEHAVLGGSEKYPLKEPFVQLIKGSLNTFLNAFTSPDKTTYPVASTNLQDFYNLVDVYLDAVFHPLITPQHLAQEGWHYELTDVNAPLTYKGVVFNEMKGAYSSPDSLLYRAAQQALFPDNAYRFDSGGDPAVIPDLTYAQFRHFHATYYHPSNARIFFYGDDDPAERLRILDAVLGDYSAARVDGLVALQAPFAAPRGKTVRYGVDAQSDSSRKAMVLVNWALPEMKDTALMMALNVLSYALVSTQASPLRKALVDSGLGEDVIGGGISASLRQPTFGVGMKGIAVADAGKVEALIFDTLAQLATDGLEDEMVDAAVNTIEFSLRENNTGSYPRGLSLFMRALRPWLHGQDPIGPLRYETPLAAVKQRLAADPKFLPTLIRTYLLENQHRATVTLEPDPTYNQQLEADERARLDAAQAAMTPAKLQQVVDEGLELKRRQEAPDAPADLAKLPVLTLADLDRLNKPIPREVIELPAGKVVFHDLFTNGIVYLRVGFDLQTVPADLLPYAEFFAKSLLEMGTEREDYVKLSQRIGRKTGGIGYSTFVSPLRAKPEGTAWLFVSGKSTLMQAQELLDILREMLLTVKLDNPARFRQIVLKTRARLEASLVPAGHSYVGGRLRAGFTKAGWADEQIDGIAYLFFVRKLAEEIEQDWPGVLAKLEAVKQALVNRRRSIVDVTTDAADWALFRPQLMAFLDELPAADLTTEVWPDAAMPIREGLVVPAQINYVGKAANLYELGYKYDGSIHVITNFMRTSWLWDRVRAVGGAYGAFVSFGKQSGVLTYLSYRDPNLLGTLATYDATAEFLRTVEIDEAELTKNIIGAIREIDGYQVPDAKGWSSLVRYLVNESDEDRQRMRDEVLLTTVQDFRDFAEVLAAMPERSRVVVMGSGEALAGREWGWNLRGCCRQGDNGRLGDKEKGRRGDGRAHLSARPLGVWRRKRLTVGHDDHGYEPLEGVW